MSWADEHVSSASKAPEDVYSEKLSDLVDVSTLKLDVERLRFKWNGSRYEPCSDVEDSNATKDDTPQYTPKCAFAIAKIIKPRQNSASAEVKKSIHAWSPHFLRGARAVLEGSANVAWGIKPLQLDADEMLKFLPLFDKHIHSLEAQEGVSNADADAAEVLAQLRFFVGLLRAEYATKLETLADHLAEKQITFDLIPLVFVPGTLLITHCDLTGEPLIVRLAACKLVQDRCDRSWTLESDVVGMDEDGLPGLGSYYVYIPDFAGAESIVDLPAFPMVPYLDESRRAELRAALIKRGRRYWELGHKWCHKQYDAVAYFSYSFKKTEIHSRIMLDRAKYCSYAQGDSPSFADRDLDGVTLRRKGLTKKDAPRRVDLTEDDYMLMPVKLYGFDLADRDWLVFNVEHVKDIEWNTEAFDHLDIHPDKKEIVKTLILSHTQKASEFDDFVQGKGRGLIFALHGPPGVGKTLTAEATSEVARAPLYMVGAGDLGTHPDDVDSALQRVLTLSSAWKAVVLIDEADVFLEKRDLHDLVRNAMVAVFLRQLEYYKGILILTTNRLSTIDGAMKSRIHVSLHYAALTAEVRGRLWTVFLQKAGLKNGLDTAETKLLDQLCERELNGREIKNVIKTATTYAAYHGRVVTIQDILRVVSITDDMREVPPIQ